MNQQGTQIDVATLADSQQFCFFGELFNNAPSNCIPEHSEVMAYSPGKDKEMPNEMAVFQS